MLNSPNTAAIKMNTTRANSKSIRLSSNLRELITQQFANTKKIFQTIAFILFTSPFSYSFAQEVIKANPVTPAAVPDNNQIEPSKLSLNPTVESLTDDPKSGKPKAKSKPKKRQEIINPWGVLKGITEKDNSSRIKVNIDSLYSVYAENRIYMQTDEPSYFVMRVIPNAILERLTLLDSALYDHIQVENNFFSIFTARNATEAQQLKRYYELIFQLPNELSLSAQQIFTEVLPPLPVYSYPLTIDQYKNFIDNYFRTHAEVIKNCSAEFLLLMVRKQYALMYALHKDTGNKVLIGIDPKN